MVQLDYDKEEEPWYAVCGPVLAELEVQRTIKKRQSYGIRRLVGPSTLHSESMGMIDGLWRTGEGSCWTRAEGCGRVDNIMGVADGVCRDDLGPGERTPHWEGKEGHDEGANFVVKRNEKADELAK